MIDSETSVWLYSDLNETIDMSGSDVKCEDCKWFEPFNAICFNGDSEYCAGCPMEDGVDGCEKGELKDEQN